MLDHNLVTRAKNLLVHLQRSKGSWTRPPRFQNQPTHGHNDYDMRLNEWASARNVTLSDDERLQILIEEIRFFYESVQRNSEGNASITQLVSYADMIEGVLKEAANG